MKKFFLLASVALCFAACSSSENEEIEAAHNGTRFAASDDCGRPTCALNGVVEHYHCVNTWCYGYINPFTTAGEMHDHSYGMNHGGDAIFE